MADHMKIILAGYDGSKHILAASSYLLAKYTDVTFDVRFLNFGDYAGTLSIGKYESLANVQAGGADAWGRYIAAYLAHIQDEFVIFALDDYFFYREMNFKAYAGIMFKMRSDKDVVCGRLCGSNFYSAGEKDIIREFGLDFVVLRANAQYSSTTQYCVWRKSFLTDLLRRYSNPWRFEVEGSEYLNKTGMKTIGTVEQAMFYDEHSCLSTRWPGKVKAPECQKADIDHLIELGHLKTGELIL